MFFIRNLRAVIIAWLAIPASIVATFTLMRAMDFTLNNMTLLGITLAVGIVIDDAIVVLENIFRYIEEKNCTPFEAAIRGTNEVTLAVMATTLSLVVIFLPVAFMTGYARRFINPFGWTMAFSIMVSMLVSFTLTPMLSSRFLSAADAAKDHKTRKAASSAGSTVVHTVAQLVARSPAVIIGIAVAVFLTTFPFNPMVGRTFVPTEDMGEWTIHLDAPEGTSLEGSTEIAMGLVEGAEGIEGVARLQPTISRARHPHPSDRAGAAARGAHEHTGTDGHRDATAPRRASRPQAEHHQPQSARRRRVGRIPDFSEPARSRSEVLASYSLRALEQAQKLASLADPKVSLNIANPEIRVSVDRRRAADLGVRMQTVGDALRLMVAGDDEISTYREGAEQYPVKMRVLESQRRDLEAIGKLTVASSRGELVRIDNIAGSSAASARARCSASIGSSRST